MNTSRVSSLGRLLETALIAALVAFSSPVRALTIPFASGGLSGSVQLTAGTNQVFVVLTDTTSPMRSIANLVSDVSFAVTGGHSIAATQTVVPTGSLVRCINGNASCTPVGGSAHPWYYGMNGTVGSQGTLGSGTYILTALVGSSRSLIISNTNFSCRGPGNKCPGGLGNPVNQPYLLGSGSFTLNIPGVSPQSTFSHVALSFGTAPDVVVPIPVAAWLFASGLLGLIGIARRRITGAPAVLPALA